MATRYRADCSAANVSGGSTAEPVYEVLYQVPSGCIAKLTYLNGTASAHIVISKDGGETKLQAITISSSNQNYVDWGVYFNEGDILYLESSTTGSKYAFMCVILEYEED